jgi:hypothetical protein
MDILLHLLFDIRPVSMSDFTDEAIRNSFEAFFVGPFCSAYAERAVVTLFPDFLVLRSRWGARMDGIGETDNPIMQMKDQIIMGPSGRELYRCIMLSCPPSGGPCTILGFGHQEICYGASSQARGDNQQASRGGDCIVAGRDGI